MNKYLIAAAVAAAIAAPAGAQSTSAAGQVQASQAARVEVKVNQSLANTARISGDSAFALARARVAPGEVSSAELEMKDGRLVYEVHVLNPSKRASSVWIDAMTGETLEVTKHGGLKSTLMHHKENKKLTNAKRDSAAKNP
jgi:uncharacterized membrane protein YkoI